MRRKFHDHVNCVHPYLPFNLLGAVCPVGCFCPACRCGVGRPPRDIVWFQLRNGSWRWAVAVVFSMAQVRAAGGEHGAGDGAAAGVLAGFRRELYWSLTRRADALFEVADAVACSPGRVTDLARLSLAPEF